MWPSGHDPSRPNHPDMMTDWQILKEVVPVPWNLPWLLPGQGICQEH